MFFIKIYIRHFIANVFFISAYLICIEGLYAQKAIIVKLDAGRCFWGEYGATFEKKIVTNRFLHSPTGNYEIESYLNNLDPKKARMSPFMKAYLFFVNDYNKFYQLNLAITHNDFEQQREVFNGITGRAFYRRYFSKKTPYGFSVSAGLSTGFFMIHNYNDFHETLQRTNLIKPSVIFPMLSYQFGMQKKKTFIFEVYGSLESSYPIQINNRDQFIIKNKPQYFSGIFGFQIGLLLPRRVWVIGD